MKTYTIDHLPDIPLDPPEDEPRTVDDREPPDDWPTDEDSGRAGDEYEAELDRKADAREVFLTRLSKWGRAEP